jgi:hypothetical protein
MHYAASRPVLACVRWADFGRIWPSKGAQKRQNLLNGTKAKNAGKPLFAGVLMVDATGIEPVTSPV